MFREKNTPAGSAARTPEEHLHMHLIDIEQ